MNNIAHSIIRSISRIASLLILVTASVSLTYAAPAVFDKAVADYNNRNYSQALTKFQEICRVNNRDAMTHYYLALCYQALNQIKLAQQEYTWIYGNASDKRLVYNSYQALQQIQRWNTKRAYSGQGNNFARYGSAPARRSPALPSGIG